MKIIAMKKRNFLLAVLLMPLLLWAREKSISSCEQKGKNTIHTVAPEEDRFAVKSSVELLVP